MHPVRAVAVPLLLAQKLAQLLALLARDLQ
jgi:hypothetical protein